MFSLFLFVLYRHAWKHISEDSNRCIMIATMWDLGVSAHIFWVFKRWSVSAGGFVPACLATAKRNCQGDFSKCWGGHNLLDLVWKCFGDQLDKYMQLYHSMISQWFIYEVNHKHFTCSKAWGPSSLHSISDYGPHSPNRGCTNRSSGSCTLSRLKSTWRKVVHRTIPTLNPLLFTKGVVCRCSIHVGSHQ